MVVEEEDLDSNQEMEMVVRGNALMQIMDQQIPLLGLAVMTKLKAGAINATKKVIGVELVKRVWCIYVKSAREQMFASFYCQKVMMTVV